MKLRRFSSMRALRSSRRAKKPKRGFLVGSADDSLSSSATASSALRFLSKARAFQTFDFSAKSGFVCETDGVSTAATEGSDSSATTGVGGLLGDVSSLEMNDCDVAVAGFEGRISSSSVSIEARTIGDDGSTEDATLPSSSTTISGVFAVDRVSGFDTTGAAARLRPRATSGGVANCSGISTPCF
jgi:hypothetical protein